MSLRVQRSGTQQSQRFWDFLGLLPYGRNDGYLNGHDVKEIYLLRQAVLKQGRGEKSLTEQPYLSTCFSL
ncbi:hypothetical protein [Dendronalium sp. ChiSLP03b]|uniref:hypothetical protein n=1 Tax=Dendronalium sp. ChiSLP03b TaxID=3075381 RepID=UPI002AD25D75|nr:hypothetical protein [Dendronalium sp. ChiSLP03b]MDZ8207793.1 hypothetical protein [Dendronalium sp. ChiSLP03b]